MTDKIMTLQLFGELKEKCGPVICPRGKALDVLVIEDKFTKDKSAHFLLYIWDDAHSLENINPYLYPTQNAMDYPY